MVVVKNIILLNQKISIFKKNGLFYIYIYNKNFFLILKTNLLVGIKNSNEFLFFEKGTINRRLQGKQDLNSFLKQFYMYSYSKLKFTGKGYKIKKNKKCNMMLLFNRSHITNIFWKNIFIKKIKKYKMYVCGTKNNICKIISTILNTRSINIFTKKGLRVSRQILLKKKNKKK